MNLLLYSPGGSEHRLCGGWPIDAIREFSTRSMWFKPRQGTRAQTGASCQSTVGDPARPARIQHPASTRCACFHIPEPDLHLHPTLTPSQPDLCLCTCHHSEQNRTEQNNLVIVQTRPPRDRTLTTALLASLHDLVIPHYPRLFVSISPDSLL